MVKKKVNKAKKTGKMVERKPPKKAVALKKAAVVKKPGEKKVIQKTTAAKKQVKAEKAEEKGIKQKTAPVKKPVEIKDKSGHAVEKVEKPKKLGEKDVIFTVGKRKRAVARARIKKGAGAVEINKRPLVFFSNEIAVMKIREPLMLAGEDVKRFDISVNVKGGGIMSQAEACRQAVARGLVQIMGSNIKQRFLAYDRSLLVYDPRRTEPHKPSRSSKGARRYKQRSKR
jgi:small subunit ribosomal protein S9